MSSSSAHATPTVSNNRRQSTNRRSSTTGSGDGGNSSDSIKVVCRFRPFKHKTTNTTSSSAAFSVNDVDNYVNVQVNGLESKTFAFDKVCIPI